MNTLSWPDWFDKSFKTFFGGFFKSWKKNFLSTYGLIFPVPSGSNSVNASIYFAEVVVDDDDVDVVLFVDETVEF